MIVVKHIGLLIVHVIFYAGAALILPPVAVIDVPTVAFAVFLIWISMRDIVSFEIPDVAVTLLLAVGILAAGDLTAMLAAAAAAAFWAALYLAMALSATVVLGKNALGLGDVKLIGGLAAWTGFVAPIQITLFASLAAIATIVILSAIHRKKPDEMLGVGIAFGPFLCLSGWVILLQGGRI